MCTIKNVLYICALFILHLGVHAEDISLKVNGREYEYFINSTRTINIAYIADESSRNPFRLEVSSALASHDYPVMVVVRQEKLVESWQLPLMVETSNPQATNAFVQYHKTARTLCNAPLTLPGGYSLINAEKPKTNFTVTLSTFSKHNVRVVIRATMVKDYFLEPDREYQTRFSPSEPVYYAYQFKNKDVKTVMLNVASDDDVCFTVSVQPHICPIYDLNNHITYQGRYQTVNKKGGLAIHRSQFSEYSSHGFVVVFVAKSDNYECDVKASLPLTYVESINENKQTSKVIFSVKTAKKEGEYAIAIFSLLGLNLILCVLCFILTYIFYRKGNYYNVNMDDYERPQPYVEPNDDQVDKLQENPEPKLSDFLYHGKRNKKKALNYFWHIGNIAIFYGLPVIQLMIFYHRAVTYSGDMDICYYNSQCSHPLYFTDFNHVYSNIGYVMFGLLFLGITLFRSIKVHNKTGKGIPKLYGHYYAMGMALTFEGVLSGCYHICPNQSNFQFDTSFMYVMAILIITKLYQNRHPDTQASAYSTFSILGISVVVAMFGILFNSVAVTIIFFICYLLFSIYMTFKLYFFTNAGKRLKLVFDTYKKNKNIGEFKPIRTQLFVFLVIANILNLTLAISGFFLYPKYVDFGTYLLMILMGNAILYAIFYTIMKVVKGERICFEAIMYGLLATLLWAAGSYFFFNAATKWSATPAQSRLLNQECMILDFYDTHDIWHIISAPALFFSFLFLMALDDDLHDLDRTEIIVF